VHKFKAYRTFEEDKVVSSRFVEMSIPELDPGEVVIKAKYSTINYKDALSFNGAGRIMRKYPTNAGIDVAGTVESSADPRFKPGDKAIVTGYDLGVAHDGGYAEHVRVPADWVVRRPESMTAFDAMTLGTAGFTAALAILLMEHNGLTPASGPVAVTGATGGVGSVAIEILRKIGYHVVAITAKPEEAAYLKEIGASEVLLRQSLDVTNIRPLGKATWAGVVDNLGGDLLASLISMMKIGGTVASVGLAADTKLNTTGDAVHPARGAPARRRQCELRHVDPAEAVEQAGRRVASRPCPRSRPNHRFRRPADALRPVSQGSRARTYGRAHRPRFARRMI
jgi:putative YhdH/YhfP family quinone oxidoreductase